MIRAASISTRFARWQSSLLTGIAPHLLTWALLITVIALMADNVTNAAWVSDSSPLVNGLWCGLILGILLAGSRFRGWGAAIYHFGVAFLLFGLWIGKIFPSWGQLIGLSPAANLELANIRLLAYLDRLLDWIVTFISGHAVQDNGLFVLLIGLLAWSASAWLAWSVVRRQRALDGLLPIGLVLGINTYLSGQSIDALGWFIACACLLLARTAIVELLATWEHRRVDYPDELSWNWAAAALGLGVIIFFAARLAPLLGTPEGWKTLGDMLREAQKQVEHTTSRLFGDVAPAASYPEEEFTPQPWAPSAETPQLGLVGPSPLQSSALVMWVKTSDPAPIELEAGMPEQIRESRTIHYWRSNVFGKYTGVGWEGVDITETAPAGVYRLPAVSGPFPTPGDGVQKTPPSPVVGRYLLTQEFEILARHDEALFAANAPAGVTPGRILYAGPEGTPLVYGRSVSKYALQSWVTQTTDVMLRAAPAAYPPEISGLYLQLPLSLPQRVRDLARRVAGDAANPFDKATRIQDYLRLSYPYDLKAPPPPAGRDVVDYFLYDSNGGFCSYFASAMVVMLRSQGVPARVASGYANGSYDFKQGAYRVTPSDSHAWVEVYFPNYGWVEFEPTPGLQRIPYETPGGGAPSGVNDLPSRPHPPPPAWQGGALVVGAILTPVVLFGLAFWLRARRRARPSEPPARLAERHYLRLRRLLAWGGLAAPLSATPAEYLSASAPTLAGRGRLPDALALATTIYQRAAYSPYPPSYEEIERARRLAWQGWEEWVKLVFRRFRK